MTRSHANAQYPNGKRSALFEAEAPSPEEP